MALQLGRSSTAGLFAGQAQVARRSSRQAQVVKAAKGPYVPTLPPCAPAAPVAPLNHTTAAPPPVPPLPLRGLWRPGWQPDARPRALALLRASKTSKVKKAAAKARKTAPSKKIQVDEDTATSVGAAGIFGVAVLTAGSLFLNSAQVEYVEGQVRGKAALTQRAPLLAISLSWDYW